MLSLPVVGRRFLGRASAERGKKCWQATHPQGNGAGGGVLCNGWWVCGIICALSCTLGERAIFLFPMRCNEKREWHEIRNVLNNVRDAPFGLHYAACILKKYFLS